MANGTRTAPNIGTADISYLLVSLHWIDTVGDIRSDSYQCNASDVNADYDAVLALIETFVAKMVLASNASLWRVEVNHVFNGAIAKSNALNVTFYSADDVTNILEKKADNRAQDIIIRAPLAATMVAGTKTPNGSAALLTDIETAFQAIVEGTYATISYRFSEHRDIGKRVRK